MYLAVVHGLRLYVGPGGSFITYTFSIGYELPFIYTGFWKGKGPGAGRCP